MVKPVSDLHQTHDAVWRCVTMREGVIRRLAEFPRVPEAELTRAMAELNLGRTQVYNLLSRYRSNSVTSTLLPSRPGPANGHSRVDIEIEKVIDRLIDQHYESDQKPVVAALCRAIAHECHKQGVRAPSRTAVQARIARRNARQLVSKREGAKAASDRFRPVPNSYDVDAALAVVQIDHTLVDQIIVDDHNREPVGRPWLTIAIDVASRMVTGFYLTLEHPSAVSVGMAIRHAVLPKTEWLAERGIKAPWPVEGLPDRIHMDNAREFHSRALTRGCGEYGIDRAFRPMATPHYGGHIERLIGTMMGAVHLLPGTTFSNTVERGAYEAEAKSAMTLAELEAWLAIQIVGVYHASLHQGLGKPPNTAWEQALKRRRRPPRHPPDANQFLLDFLPFEHRMVRRDGIQLFNLRYWDPLLTTWIGAKMQMPVKYDPRDLSRIFLQAPDGQHWPIPYADLGRPPITLWEHRRAMSLLQEEGRAAVNETLIFEAVEAQRALVAGATHRTIKARRAANRTAHALAHGAPAEGSRDTDLTPSPIGPPNEQDDYLPYPLEEWS